MDPVHALTEPDSGEMRQEIDCTRSALADKLEALEDKVMDTVQSARETVEESIQTARDSVEETVETVKTSVRETVATVKRTFDIKHQVEQHPWAMVGGCFLTGLALGSLAHRLRRRSPRAPDRPAGNETPLTQPSTPRGEGWVRGSGSLPFSAEQRGNGSSAAAAPPRLSSAPSSRPGFFDFFQEEIDQAKGMAVSYVMGLARDSIKGSVPQLASQIDDVMNRVTTKLGGKPVQQQST